MLLFLLLAQFAFAEEIPAKAVKIESLVAKVGREAVTTADLERFRDMDSVLTCAGVKKREGSLPTEIRPLLEAYIEEELMYQEARSRKLTTSGLIPETVKSIHSNSTCKQRWQSLGEKYLEAWKTETRPQEGQSILVRELEKRILVEKFRKTEIVGDTELWKRESKARYPVKIYLE